MAQQPSTSHLAESLWLRVYTKLLVLATFCLIIAGGLVTSTDSGLAVPDWPLSYGQWMPPMTGSVAFEHSHRMMASLVGFMTLVLSVWLGFVEERRWVRWIGIAGLAAVVLQGLLGGMTVLYRLPAPVSILHGCLAQTFFALVIALAFFTSNEWRLKQETLGSAAGILKPYAASVFIVLYVQLILGAAFRHTGDRVVLIPHVAGGFAAIVAAGVFLSMVMQHCAGETGLIRPGVALGITTIVQFGLGIGSFVYRTVLTEQFQQGPSEVFFVTSHQALGALLLGLSVFITLRIWRRAA